MAILPAQFTTPLLEEPLPHPPLLPLILLRDNDPHITLGERIPTCSTATKYNSPSFMSGARFKRLITCLTTAQLTCRKFKNLAEPNL